MRRSHLRAVRVVVLPVARPIGSAVAGATSAASYEVFQFPAGRLPSDFQADFDADGNRIT